MTARTRLIRSATAIAMAALGAACGASSESSGTTDSALLGQDGSDTSEVETQVSSLTAAFTLAQTAAPARDVASVLDAAGQAHTYFEPAGCLSIARDAVAHSVTYTLDRCSGPWGLARVSGTVTSVYSLSTAADGSSVLGVDVSGDGLELGRATVSWRGLATVTASGLARDMTWTGDLTGTTARGRALHRSAHWDVKWSVGQSCVRIDGTAEGDVVGRGFSTTVTDYVRCKGACPAAGGDVAIVEKASGRAIDVSFTGSNVATVRGDGAIYDVTLACGS